MAEIITSAHSNEKGKKLTTKRSTRIDMTPMVDLGFLLITFFMFTTQFTKPNIMNLGLPAKGTTDPTEIDYRNQITFLLGKDNRIFYYQQELQNLNASDIKETSYDGVEIAKLITAKKAIAPKADFFTIIIKPTDESTYQNFVDVMDEIAISKNERYGVTDLQKIEENIYKTITK